MSDLSDNDDSRTWIAEGFDDLVFQSQLSGGGEHPLPEAVAGELKQAKSKQVRCDLVNFSVDREGLLVLAKHWVEIMLREEQMWFLRGQSTSARHVCHARRELKRLAEVLGIAAVKAVWEEGNTAMRRLFGESLWKIYQHGTGEEWDRVVEETSANARYCEAKLADSILKARALTVLRANPTGLFVDVDGDLWSLVDANHDQSSEDARLTLLLTTRDKGSVLDPTVTIERPADWVPPTWFGRGWQSE